MGRLPIHSRLACGWRMPARRCDAADMDTNLDPAVIALAAGQDGMFTTTQAHRAGMDKDSLWEAVRRGELLHPNRSLYAVASLVDSASPERWHQHHARGVALLYPDLQFTSVTGVLAHGLCIWGCALDRPRILRPIKRSTGVRGVSVRPARGETAETGWGRAATVADCLVQLALDFGVEAGVVSADDALRRGAVGADGLSNAVERVTRWPKAHRARSMAALACGLRESVAESRCAVALTVAGIDAVPQVTVRDDSGRIFARVDFLVKGTKVVIEVDGKVKFASGDPDVLWAEKRREDQLRAMGYTVVRITWADLETPGGVAAKVRRALLAAAA